jgi:diguanylate cyclase (GGDEF)-like protein
MTVSIGLAVYPDDSEDVSDLIERADKALYAAKSSGKNIVCEYKE